MGKRIVYCFAALLLMVAVYCGIRDPMPPAVEKPLQPELSVQVQLGSDTEELSVWQSGEGDFHVFLPSGAGLARQC